MSNYGSSSKCPICHKDLKYKGEMHTRCRKFLNEVLQCLPKNQEFSAKYKAERYGLPGLWSYIENRSI